MFENIEESLPEKEYTALNFINDVIWALKRLIPMYMAVIIGVYILALYNPQVKATLLNVWALCNPDVKDAIHEMQNNIFRMFQ
jgi:hypothetical protein